jgi:dolichol-phosphate mannosyltransferase
MLTVIIPTINEEKTIGILIHQINKLPLDAKVIVVDDASKDRTPFLAEDAGAIVIRRPQRMGIVSAFTDALKLVTTPYVALCDADLQHPPELLTSMLKNCAPNTLVIGSRYAEGSTISASFKRNAISNGAIMLCHFVAPYTRKCRDITSGFVMMPTDIANTTIFKDPKGWKIIPYILKTHPDLNIIELGYKYHERDGKGSKLEIRTILHYIVSLWNLVTL